MHTLELVVEKAKLALNALGNSTLEQQKTFFEKIIETNDNLSVNWLPYNYDYKKIFADIAQLQFPVTPRTFGINDHINKQYEDVSIYNGNCNITIHHGWNVYYLLLLKYASILALHDVMDKLELNDLQSIIQPEETTPTPHPTKIDAHEHQKFNDAKKVFDRWNEVEDGILRGISQDDFFEMINNRDFSKLNNRNSNAVKYTIYLLSRIYGDEWGNNTAKSFKKGFNLSQCKSATNFPQFDAYFKGFFKY